MRPKNNWILLRGLARGVGHWGSFAEKIQEHFPQDAFEFLDLPGNGQRHDETSPTSIPEYVKDLRSRSAFVSRGESFNILAVSLGAMIAVEWVRQFPHEVQKAFLVCTSSAGESAFYERFQLPNYVKALSLIGAKDEVKWERTVLDMVVNNHERKESELLSMVTYTKTHPMRMENILRQLLAASRYRFPAEVPGDVHLIGSYGDRLVSPKCTLQIAEKWGLKASMHPWAGHDVPIDDPHWLLERLL